MEVMIFGKLNCGKCAGTKERVGVLIDKMGLAGIVPLKFINLDTIDGRAEGAFYDVYDAVPVTIIRGETQDVLSRWEGIMPKSEELKPVLENANRAAQIKGFVQNSLIEWPGRISSILFLPGCNFRCPFCHAAHLVIRPNELESIPFDSILAFFKERGDWLDGVIISGGEPTTSEGLPELMAAIHALKLPIKLYTNGTHPEAIERFAAEGLLAAVSMDIKGPLDERYERLAGVPVDLDVIRRSIDFLRSGAVAEYEFRTTVPPGMLGEEEIEDIARSLAGAQNFILQGFLAQDCIDRNLMDLKPYTTEELKGFAEKASPYVNRCYVRGIEEPVSPQAKQ